MWQRKGECYLSLESYDKAIECLERANTIQKCGQTLTLLGKVLVSQRRYDEAIRFYNEVLDRLVVLAMG